MKDIDDNIKIIVKIEDLGEITIAENIKMTIDPITEKQLDDKLKALEYC